MKIYMQIEDLPRSVKKNLPEPAQRLYLATYRVAMDRYRKIEPDVSKLANSAHKAALFAVDRHFYRDADGVWCFVQVKGDISMEIMKNVTLSQHQ